MVRHVNLSSVLYDAGGRTFDPQHGHSFHRVVLSDLPAIHHSRLFFRDCLLCGQRILSFGRPSGNHGSVSRKRRIPPQRLRPTPSPTLFPPNPTTAPDASSDIVRQATAIPKVHESSTQDVVCQCMSCGNHVHRECLSLCHSHRRCLGHNELMPVCPQPSLATPTADTPTKSSSLKTVKRVLPARRLFSSSNVSISSLIDELSDDNRSREQTSPPKPKKTTAATVMKRAAPFLAAGGVIGAIALGPAGAAIAGLNMLVASVSVEGVVAGLGFTAATAAATASHQIKKKQEQKRREEELKSGAWAMEICWKLKQAFKDTPLSDEVFRKDAELLRRFQLPRRTTAEVDQLQPPDHFAPTRDEIYALLFSLFSTSSEYLSQVHAELGKAFTERHATRLKRAAAAASSSPFQSADAAATRTAAVCRDTLQDAKMYVAHLVGATMQTMPSLSSTEAAIVSCSQAVERVVFDDVYATVIGVIDTVFASENALFYASLDEIRRQQGGYRHQLEAMLQHLHASQPVNLNECGSTVSLASIDDLGDAEAKLVAMMDSTTSPSCKLELLCGAFRAICCFADRLHQTASNADILIPIVCAVLVASPQFSLQDSSRSQSNFVSQIAFTSFFTRGGGKGVEGYVLTTFQAALQVIAAVDFSQGHAKELELFQSPTTDDSSSATDDNDDSDEFFDAASTS